MSRKREFVIIYPRDDSLSLLPVWVSHWHMDYLVEFVESSYSDALRGMESVGDFGIDTEFYDFRVEKGEEYTSMIFWRTGEELFRFANDDLSRLLETWHRVTDEGADRTLTTIEDGVPRMFAKYKPRSPPLISLASTGFFSGVLRRQGVGEDPPFMLTDFYRVLPEEKDEEVRKFVEDENAREMKIGAFVLTKKLWKIVVSGRALQSEVMHERMVSRGDLLRLLRDFRVAMATRPRQIAIARDSRRLMVITDKTAEKLLFWK